MSAAPSRHSPASERGSQGTPKTGSPGSTRWWSTKKHWSHERIVEAIREWHSLYGRPPSQREWTKSRERKDGRSRWPPPYAVTRYCGTWSKAIRAAGYVPLPPGGSYGSRATNQRSRTHPWTQEEVITLLQKDVADNQGIAPTVKDWVGNPERPAPTTVRKLFGSWASAVQAAGFVPLPPNVTRKALSKYLIPRKEGES